MRAPFVSLITNDQYQIGCTGQTMVLLDASGKELAKFRDMPYAYYTAFHPSDEIAAVFSNTGIMAIYSLSERRLITKFRVSAVKDTQTDRVPCFSPDGNYLYHIEGRKGDGLNSRLSVYSTADYQPVLRLFEKEPRNVFDCMEFDRDTAALFLFGYFRKANGNDYFVAQLVDQSLQNVKLLDRGTYEFYQSAMHIKQAGFTQEAFQWSSFVPNTPADPRAFNRKYTLDDLKRMNPSLSKLWKET